jgi:predicted GNAT family N-acyltransferase
MIRIVSTEGEMDAARGVRRRVFIEEQGVPEVEEWDDLDAAARHFLVLQDGAVIGTARLVLKDDGTGKIGRVAILREHRGAGHGAALVRHLVDDAAALGCRELILDAQVQVVEFYERLGFRAEGEPFMDAGILHRRMRLRV